MARVLSASKGRTGRRSRRGEPTDCPGRALRQAVYCLVARIPKGRVATYGQLATLAGYPGRARQVGYALAGMPEDLDLPWHRVINAQGKISPRTSSKFHELQYSLLEQEGIVFVENRIDLRQYLWEPAAGRSSRSVSVRRRGRD